MGALLYLANVAESEKLRRRPVVLPRSDCDDAIGPGIRQCPEENRIDGAEDGGARSDPESEREHGHRGESGALAQEPEALADVTPRLLDHVLPAVGSHLFAQRRLVADLH